MKIVLDTNVLASGIFWGGTPLTILQLWQKKRIQLLASEAVLHEYLRTIECIAEKIRRPDLQRSWNMSLPSKLRIIVVRKSFQICRDPNDDMFIDCAIAGKARYIVSGDRDLLDLKQIMNVRIMSAQNFLRQL